MIYLFVFNYFCFRVHYLLTSATRTDRAALMPPLKREEAKIPEFLPEGLSPQIKLNFMCRKDSAESQSLSHIAYIKYACASPLCKGAMKQQR